MVCHSFLVSSDHRGCKCNRKNAVIYFKKSNWFLFQSSHSLTSSPTLKVRLDSKHHISASNVQENGSYPCLSGVHTACTHSENKVSSVDLRPCCFLFVLAGVFCYLLKRATPWCSVLRSFVSLIFHKQILSVCHFQ